MNEKGGIIASIIGDIFLFIGGFCGGYFFGDKIITIVRGWLNI